MKCCVSKQIFDGNFPPELVIPNKNKQTIEVTTTSSPRSPQQTQANTPEPKVENNKNQADPGSCSGTCVSGFLALLCDEIDRTAFCPGSGRCCLTKKVEPSSRPVADNKPSNAGKCPGFCLPQHMSSLCASPSNILHNTNSCSKGTVCCESKSAAGSSNERTPPPPPPTTQRPPPPRPQRPSGGAGGPDFTSLLLSAAPTILSAATGNSDAGTTAAALLPVIGTLLGSGGSGGGGGGPPNRVSAPPAQDAGAGGLVASLLPTLMGTFLGGGGNQRVPPRQPSPYRPPVPTSAPVTTTTTTTTEKPDDRPECPGTCIASYLSFTCFGE